MRFNSCATALSVTLRAFSRHIALKPDFGLKAVALPGP